MKRLTHERCNGIRTGYWSPEKKDDLVNALEAYENTGLTSDQIQELKERDTAKAPVKDIDSGIRYTDEYVCPNCGKHFTGTGIADYCYHCGQRLKWETHE